jgi:predicted aldo/keto reductase-like oxidoreductase
MRMRILGKTGLQVSELCLGTGSFGGRDGYERTGSIQQKDADYIVGIALDAGINFFNTAETYSSGWAEEFSGKRWLIVVRKLSSSIKSIRQGLQGRMTEGFHVNISLRDAMQA